MTPVPRVAPGRPVGSHEPKGEREAAPAGAPPRRPMDVLAALVATVVAVSFSGALVGQWRARRRHHAASWAVALALFALGSLFLALGQALGWSPLTFGGYWLTGALLTVPWLAVGQLHLLAPGLHRWWWGFGGLATLAALLAVSTAGADGAALEAASRAGEIPVGAEVYSGGAVLGLLRPANLLAVVVVVGSVWSWWRTRRAAVLLIAVGVLVAGLSFSAARSFEGALQAVVTALLLAAGVSVMFAGFKAAGRVVPAPPSAHGRGRVG